MNESVQKLRQFVIEYGLPKTDMALFGIKCLYCGKSDRIRQLEIPDELHEKMDSKDMKRYSDLWKRLTQSGDSLGVCKFCQNLLKLYLEKGKAEALYKGGEIMQVEVLGPGCKRCDDLYENTVAAASEFDPSVDIAVKKVKDINYFAKMGVFMTPGLVIEGKVVSVGKVLSIEEIKEKIKESM